MNPITMMIGKAVSKFYPNMKNIDVPDSTDFGAWRFNLEFENAPTESIIIKSGFDDAIRSACVLADEKNAKWLRYIPT